MKRALFACVLLIALGMAAQTVPGNRDVLGAHDFSSGASQVRGEQANACMYCHVPHRGGQTALWNQTLSTQPYNMYSSGTSQNAFQQPTLGRSSTLCLSCHDGTVAVGQTIAFGQIRMTGTMSSVLGTTLQSSHPFSLQLPIKDAAHLVPSLAASQTTNDPTKAVLLVDGNIECNTCHNGHNQTIDKHSPTFLVRDNAGGQLCLSCHSTAPRTVNGTDNILAKWPASIHANSSAQVAPKAGLGGYTTVGEFACSSCHVPHNSAGGGLVRKTANQQPTIDSTSQSCFTCHDGSDNLAQPIANVLADFQKTGHPFADSNNPHAPGEPVVLDRNRHATCADCHQPHAASPTTTFNAPPELRSSQTGAFGVGADGATIAGAATKQYENCLRCHGTSQGKQSLTTYGYLPARAVFSNDALNLIPQFSTTAGSTHPVMRDSSLQSQPSLLKSMWDISGKIQMRPIGTRIFCTDCHNSDNNREFGGTGPNGPHGSRNNHILERQYVASQVAAGAWPTGGAGTLIINLNPTPPLDPASGGPYSLCAKCHDLNNVNSNVSFAKHSVHIQKGFSCSVCHTAHGVPAGSAAMAGKRLVNFDINVVAPNAGVLSYANNTCVLTCHMAAHNPDGSVTAAQ